MRAQGNECHPDLRAALEHLLAAGGKRIRPTLGLLVGNMLGGNSDTLVTLGAAVELLHTATLVHDDLIDGALLRRGAETLNARWSSAATVLTGDFLFARAAKLAAETDHLPLMVLFADTLADGLLALSKGPNAIKNFHVVDTRGLLKRAQLGHPGDSNDWQNEIHPNDDGYKKIAKKIEPVLEPLIGTV